LDKIWKLRSMTTCNGGVVSLLRSPSGGHVGEREVEVEREAHQGERRALRIVELCALHLS
jgi:hypothetical protein